MGGRAAAGGEERGMAPALSSSATLHSSSGETVDRQLSAE